MMASLQTVPLVAPDQARIDYLRNAGVTIKAMTRPSIMMMAMGSKAADGVFRADDGGDKWLAFPQQTDVVFWRPQDNAFATAFNRAFALGEDLIDNAGTYSIGGALTVFTEPLAWLLARRDGIVVLPSQWHRAFDRLRDAPRIALAEPLLPTYRRWMKPSWMPQLSVLRHARSSAA